MEKPNDGYSEYGYRVKDPYSLRTQSLTPGVLTLRQIAQFGYRDKLYPNTDLSVDIKATLVGYLIHHEIEGIQTIELEGDIL